MTASWLGDSHWEIDSLAKPLARAQLVACSDRAWLTAVLMRSERATGKNEERPQRREARRTSALRATGESAAGASR